MEAGDEPRWLTEEEQQTWFALAGMVTWLPDALDAQLQRDAGISHFEYQVMAMLSVSPQRTRRMSEVAALANGSLTRLSRTVDRLDKRGWVTRRPDPEDGRSTLAVLTDAGWDVVRAVAPGHVDAVRSLLFDGLSAEETACFRRVLESVVERLDPDRSLRVEAPAGQ